MTADIIPLHPDAYLPLRFETPPDEAAQAKLDYDLATAILQFAQQARNEIFQTGEALPPEKRRTILAIGFTIAGMPQP